MKREVAEKLMEQYFEFGKVFNSLTELSDQVEDAEVGKTIRRANAEAFFSLHDVIIGAIRGEYPDLIPKDN